MIKIAIIGVGKVAQDAHIPAIKESKKYQLVATVSTLKKIEEVPNFESIDDLFESGVDVNAVALCMHPKPRYDIAIKAISYGYHVLLEKPPCLSSAECKNLIKAANKKSVCIFAAWHSKYAASISPAFEWIKNHGCDDFKITWKENVLKWHPQQYWITEDGGFGVLDSGVNALSILSKLFNCKFSPFDVKFFKPKNWQTPIAAYLKLRNSDGISGSVDLNWTEKGPEKWEICFFSGNKSLILSEGGRSLTADEEKIKSNTKLESEYSCVYDHFSRLVASNESEIDFNPLVCTEAIYRAATWFELPYFSLDD